MTSALAETTVLQACRTLFGLEPSVCRGFLYYTLQPSGAKSAYRKKAKETHPDLFHGQDHALQQQQASLFREILDAYETLNRFLKEREQGLWPSAPSTPCAKRPPTYQERAARPQAAPKKKGNDFYRGQIPFRVLEFGRYLYYSGAISYWSLIEALTWQRKQRPVIGSVALRWGWLNADTLDQITAVRFVQGRFGERAVRMGLLSSFQVNTLLYYQRTTQERLGNYFVQQKILTPEQLELLASSMRKHNALVIARQRVESRRRNTYM